MKIVLASESARRKAILEELGFIFDSMPADIDERAVTSDDPLKLPLAIAQAKMDAILPLIHEDAIVIASDTVVFSGGVPRAKATNNEEAYEFISTFESVPQHVISAVVVANTHTGERVEGSDDTTVSFDHIPEKNIRDFVEGGDVFQYAGALAVQHPLFKPFVHFTGEWESLLGLPRALTKELIGRMVKECPCGSGKKYKKCHGA